MVTLNHLFQCDPKWLGENSQKTTHNHESLMIKHNDLVLSQLKLMFWLKA